MKVYTSNQIVATFAGVPIQSGRSSEGDFIKIERMNPAFSTKVGADGEVARSRSNDKRTKITVTLMQTSDTNALFSAIFLLDETAPNGAGVGAFGVKDQGGTSLHFAAESWITKPADATYAAEVGTRVWEFEAANMTGVIGGN